MTHMIDESNNRANMAYVGETPWHGLGQALTAGADLETWRREAGLDWRVLEAPVQFMNGQMQTWPDRKVLYRSDTSAPLSVMSKGFHIVQPEDVLNLYREIAKAAGFSMETAGSLDGGRRIWFLARVGEGADVVNRDRVRPYLLGATSFDGSMATILKFTAIRVVCHNTITAAVGGNIGGVRVRGEDDDQTPGKEQAFRVLHSTRWTDEVATEMRLGLGIVHNQFERFMVETRALASAPMTEAQADKFVAYLLEPYAGHKDGKRRDARESRAYARIMELFNGQAVGADMAGATRWGMLNAVTQLIDHERGPKQDSRLESAWFGTGAAIKQRAFETLQGEFARVD